MGWLNVEVPDPKAPAPEDILDKGDQAGEALAGLSPEALTIIAILIAAAIGVALLQRPFVRGVVVGGLLLVVAIAAFAK